MVATQNNAHNSEDRGGRREAGVVVVVVLVVVVSGRRGYKCGAMRRNDIGVNCYTCERPRRKML